MNCKNLLLVFVGGGLGSLCRYLFYHVTPKNLPASFPLNTLLVNVAGSFIIGVVYSLWLKTVISHDIRLFIAVGFCGGFTTFSSFSLDSLQLLANGRVFTFIAYALLSVALCLLFVWAGCLAGKELHAMIAK